MREEESEWMDGFCLFIYIMKLKWMDGFFFFVLGLGLRGYFVIKIVWEGYFVFEGDFIGW